MKDKKFTCPKCKSSVIFFGEGGYGVCSNNECKFEVSMEECKQIKSCMEMEFEEEEKKDKHHVMSD